MQDNRTLILPDRLRDSFFFEDVINQYERYSLKIESFDFSKVQFVEPYSMVSLLLMGRNYLRDNGKQLSIVNLPLDIRQYLDRMDFFKFNVFNDVGFLDKKHLLKRSSLSNRLLEITEIPGREQESVKVISDVIVRFRKKGSHILKHWIDDTIIDYFVTMISELCQNIFEHSLDSGFIAIQTYNISKKNVVCLVISDSGIGIKKSFENKKEIGYENLSDLLEMNLFNPISSKREFGYGLCQVYTIVKKLRGNIMIRSDNSSVSSIYNENNGRTSVFKRDDLAFFNGTQITIMLYG